MPSTAARMATNERAPVSGGGRPRPASPRPGFTHQCRTPTLIFTSSADSVGEFRFGQSAKGMIQADFHGVAGAKMHRLSGGWFCLVVEPFYKAGGKLARGSKPVTRQDGMRPLISKTPFILWRDLKAAMLRSRPVDRTAIARRSGQGWPNGPSRSGLPLTAPRTMKPSEQVGRNPPQTASSLSTIRCTSR